MATSTTAAHNGHVDPKEADLAKIRTMRDVFDYCNKYNLCSVAQGMIELAPPRKLRELVAEECLRDSHEVHQYGARFGAAVYLNAVRSFLERQYHAPVPPGAVLATSGVSGAIVATLLSLRHKGKTRVAILEPFYTYHKRQVEEVFGKSERFVPCDAELSPDWAALEGEFAKGLDALIVCNPGNPSGRVWTREELRRLVALVTKHDAVLIVDEIYCDMVWRGEHWSPIQDGVSPHVVVCRGWAKSLAGQSWRIGFCVSAPSRIETILTHHDPVYIAVNWQQYAIAKYITEHLDDYRTHIATNGKIMQENWRVLSALLQQELGWQPLEPHGSMYGLFRHGAESDIAAMRHGLEHGIGVAAGSMFWGGDRANTGLIRIHYGFGPETVQKIVDTVRARKAAMPHTHKKH